VRAVTRMAQEKYPFAIIRASVHRDNLASARLLENCGFHFVGLCWRASTSGQIPWLNYRT
jgi:RimJ/RimL family protein N-acetyltransferase